MPINRPKSRMLDAGSTAAPQNLGATASAGTGPDFSFADHVHARPSAADVGAIATTAKAAANGVASLDGSARLNGVQMPAISGDITINAGETTAAVNKVKGKDVSTPTVAGTIAQYDGTNIVWGSAPAGGSGGGGVTLFLNNGTTADTPTAGLPLLVNGAVYKELRKVAETNATSYTSSVLTATYSNVCGFVTDLNDPNTVEITAGLWDFNLWAQTNDARTTLRAALYKYNGATESSTLLTTSEAVTVAVAADQYVFSLILPQTTIEATDRICIVLQAANTAAGHTITVSFGGSSPSHVHTTISSIGGSGLAKVINGVVQSNASKLVNADVDDAAAIAQSKIDGLTTALSAKVGTGDTIAIGKGGTGQTEKSAAFNALSPITAAGDLIIGTGANTAGRVAIGTNGKVLTSNGTSATWETPAAGGGVTTIANGGTGVTTQEEARGVMGGIQTATVRYTTNITPAVAGTMTGAVWTTGSAIVTFTSANFTLLPGMSMNGGGLTANVIKTVDSATQVTMSANSTSSGSSNLTVYNSTLTTMVTGSAPAMDGRTVIAGDVILLTTQNVTATGGPWKVVSNSGSALTLTRPAWFQGVLTQPILIGLQLGSSGGGFVYTVGPNFGPLGAISIGLDPLILALTSSRAANAITGTNLFTGYQSFRANGAAANSAPFFFQAGAALMTAPQAHAVEWFNDQMYLTNAAGIRKKVSYLEDGVTISATAPSAVVFDIESSEVVYHTANTTADFTLNLRGSSTLAINSILEVNKARTVVLMVTNSTTAYKVSTVSVDGVAQTVKWLGGAAPTGNVSSIDSYSFTIIKTAANTYTVLGSVVKFA